MSEPTDGGDLLREVLDELQIRPIVHAGGTKSSMGGSAMHPDVSQIMHDGTRLYFDMEALLAAVGDGVARILGAPSAAVVAGAASGCVLAAAAVAAHPAGSRGVGHPSPHLITQRRHYGRYTYLYEQGGCAIREIATMNDCPLAWYADAIDEWTAGIAWLEGPGIRSAGAPLSEVCAHAAERGVPVIVDAAAMAHPLSTVQGYLSAGADLVVISAGKLIGGPQGAGFVLGRPDLIGRIRAMSFPHQGVGRAHKIPKEVALGAYAALRLFVAGGDERFAGYAGRADRMVAALNHSGCAARVEQNSRHLLPAVVIYDVAAQAGRLPSRVSRDQREDDVPVFFPYDDALDELYVEFASLDHHDDDVVLERLVQTFAPDARREPSHR